MYVIIFKITNQESGDFIKMKRVISFLLLFCILCCSCQEKTKSRIDMTPNERLQLALDDIFKAEAYDLNIEIKYDIIDGDKSYEYNTHIRKDTLDGVQRVHLQRIKGDDISDEYYIGTSYCSPEGKLLNPNYTFTLSSETMLNDFSMDTFGDYTYVDGEDYKTYKFIVPTKMLDGLLNKDTGMTATQAEGSIILGFDGYPKGYRIKCTSKYWNNEHSFYEYDMKITVTINHVGENTPAVEIPFEI